MVLGLLLGFVFVALAAGTKLHVSLLDIKLVGFLFPCKREIFQCLLVVLGFISSKRLAASLLLDLILTYLLRF